MSQHVRAHAIIRGRVQGVCFRMETLRAAMKLGVAGWVRNRPDGTVEAVIEGDEDTVARMLAWCRKGPALARVDSVDVERETYSGEFAQFDIAY
jgi:acylphosphatase